MEIGIFAGWSLIMFSRIYKELYYQRWFRHLCLVSNWRTMRNNPGVWHEKQSVLNKIFGRRGVRWTRD